MRARPIHILLVEDNEGDVELTREGLAESKVFNELTVVSTGEEALKFLRRQPPYQDAHRPDLIFLDLNLPRMDGRALLAAIKKEESLRRIPVIVMTTSQAEEDVVGTYDLQANCYIVKPLRFDDFVKVVRLIDDFWFSIVTLPPS